MPRRRHPPKPAPRARATRGAGEATRRDGTKAPPRRRAAARPARRSAARKPAGKPARKPKPAARPKPSSATASSQAFAATNSHIARVLQQVADLLERSRESRFRTLAWRRAARAIERLPEKVADRVAAGQSALLEVPGVGRRIAGALDEIVRTGKLGSLEELRKRAPPPWKELTRLRGVGAERARRLAEALRVGTLAELAAAARAGRIRGLRGFGLRFEEFVLSEIERIGTEPEPVHRGILERASGPLLAGVRELPGVERAELAGDLRRCRATGSGVTIVCAAHQPDAAAHAFATLIEVADVREVGGGRASVRLVSGHEARFVAVPPSRWGAALYAATGSVAHLDTLAPLLTAAHLVLDERGLHAADRPLATPEEGDVARELGIQWIPPEMREGHGEVELARRGDLPVLVRLEDVRGDLQVHSTDSDGRVPLEQMAEAAIDRGLEYVAITDHTRSLRIANGMNREGFLAQMRRIDALNERLAGKFTVLKGAEVDILRDGALDLEDDVLEALDIVLVAIHTHFGLPAAEQTDRILRALAHPSVDVLAHPMARRIGRRPAVDFDLPRIARFAAERGVLLECDATPERQDLDDDGVRVALRAGAMLIVSTDAHAPGELDHLRYGVDQARRGWARPVDVANTRVLPEFMELLHRER